MKLFCCTFVFFRGFLSEALIRRGRVCLVLLGLSLWGAAGSVRGAAPSNDSCSGAEVIPGSGPFPYLTSIIPDVSEATILGDPSVPSCLGGAATRSVWYEFTPSQSGTYRFSLGGETATTLEDTAMALYTSANGCLGPFTEMDCNDDAGLGDLTLRSALLTPLNAGNTYYVLVWSGFDPLPNKTSLQLAVSLPTVPSNDTCVGAEVIPSSGPFPYLTPLVDTLLATEVGDPPLPTCKNPDYNRRSTWYVFTPAVTSTYTVSAGVGTMTQMYDNTMAIYSSANGCAGPFVEVACSGAPNQRENITTILTAGTAYYIVIWDTEKDPPLVETELQLLVGSIAPEVVTLPATDITSSSATANATLKPNGLRTFYWFEYGTNINTATNVTFTKLVNGSVVEASVSALLENLLSSQRYHYRIVATNVNGIAAGEYQSFLWNADRPQLTSPAIPTSGGAFQFLFTGQSAQIYKVDASTNLVNWVELGGATEIGVGSFRFVDPAMPPLRSRFYRVRSP